MTKVQTPPKGVKGQRVRCVLVGGGGPLLIVPAQERDEADLAERVVRSVTPDDTRASVEAFAAVYG